MNCVCIDRPYHIRIIDKPMPIPVNKKGEALIQVKSAGICGSDIGAYRGTNNLVTYPRIIGHEIAGEVLSVDNNDRGIKTGDRVIVDPYMYCGKCYPCSIGRTNCCDNLKVLGVHIDGGMTEYFYHPSNMLVKVPDDMEWNIIPLAEPLTIALHGIHRARLKKGEHIVIIGAGAIGLLSALAAQYYGAEPIVIDIVEERLEKARDLGISHVINTKWEDTEAKVLEYTNRRKAEVVMEASGADSAVLMTLKLVTNAGRVVLTGWPKKEIFFPTEIITKKEIDILGARTSAGEFAEAIDLIYHNKINANALLTQIVSVLDADEAIKDIEQNPHKHLKTNIIF